MKILHLGRVFFHECPERTNLKSADYLVAKGRSSCKIFLLSICTSIFFLLANFSFLVFFLFLTNMPMNFFEHRDAERRARTFAFRTASLTPARAVDRASISIAAGTSSEGTASPSKTPQVHVNRTPQPPRPVDCSKGKELDVTPSKRACDGNELELPRKRHS